MGTTYVKDEVSSLIKTLNLLFATTKKDDKWSDNKTINELIKFYLMKKPTLLKKVKESIGLTTKKYLQDQGVRIL